MPSRPLTNIDLNKYVKILQIPHFRGVFMRDNLPKKVHPIECGIVNLASSNHSGSHWVAYKKHNKNIIYFDSFGNLPPPKELVKYFGTGCTVHYNYNSYQSYDSVVCGHLCLSFLHTQS